MPAEPLSVVFRLGHDPLEALVDHRRFAAVLIFLDNGEHVLDPCAQLADRLLGGCRTCACSPPVASRSACPASRSSRSGIELLDVGARSLKGAPGVWNLLRVSAPDET
jgi:hypothetical protein